MRPGYLRHVVPIFNFKAARDNRDGRTEHFARRTAPEEEKDKK
jgi:hypothetical protein